MWPQIVKLQAQKCHVFLQELERRADIWFAERMLPRCFNSWVDFTLQRRLHERRRHKAEVYNQWVTIPINTCAGINIQTKRVCLTVVISLFVCYQAASVHLGVLHLVETIRETQRADAFWADGMLDTVYSMLLIKSTAESQILTDNLTLSGNPTRGAVPLAESLGSLEAADRAADQWGGETGGFRQSLSAQTASQDDVTVEGQQQWDTRQVKQTKPCWSD